jgi:hypothetical protein
LNSTFASATAAISAEKSWNLNHGLALAVSRNLGTTSICTIYGRPHYAYLALKIPGPKGVITVKGSFEVSKTCDKEFNRMARTFGMTAEYTRFKGETDHNVLPDVGQSLPDQAFNATQDSKNVRVHPTDPTKTTSIVVNLDPT